MYVSVCCIIFNVHYCKILKRPIIYVVDFRFQLTHTHKCARATFFISCNNREFSVFFLVFCLFCSTHLCTMNEHTN